MSPIPVPPRVQDPQGLVRETTHRPGDTGSRYDAHSHPSQAPTEAPNTTETCLWIDGGGGALRTACVFTNNGMRLPLDSRLTQWWALADEPCTQARGNLPPACVQLVTFLAVRQLGVNYPERLHTGSNHPELAHRVHQPEPATGASRTRTTPVHEDERHSRSHVSAPIGPRLSRGKDLGQEVVALPMLRRGSGGYRPAGIEFPRGIYGRA